MSRFYGSMCSSSVIENQYRKIRTVTFYTIAACDNLYCITIYAYALCLKNVPLSAPYSFDMHQPILIILA